MGRALGLRERNHRPTRDARRRAIPAKSESKLPNRAYAAGRLGQVDRRSEADQFRIEVYGLPPEKCEQE